MAEQFDNQNDRQQDDLHDEDLGAEDMNPGVDKMEEPQKYERGYTLSISEEERQASFDVEDRRWETNQQVRDWTILVIAILFWLAFQL